jgi:hypothetical protein
LVRRRSRLRLAIFHSVFTVAALIGAEARVNEANFKMLLGKIEDIDTRLTRIEERFSR